MRALRHTAYLSFAHVQYRTHSLFAKFLTDVRTSFAQICTIVDYKGISRSKR